MKFQYLFFLCLPIFAIAQKNDTIPFVLTDANNIAVQCLLNQSDTLNLMLHTASGGVMLIEEAVERLTQFKSGKADTVKTWGGDATSRRSENNLLQIGNLSWDSLTIFQDRYSGPGTDGKFGINLFEGKIIEVDFDKKQIVLHEELPKRSADFEKINIKMDEYGFLFLEGKLKIGAQTLTRKFLIHSGYGGTILLDDEFVAANEIGKHLETISESELKDSFGNILKTKKAMLSQLSFGETSFQNLPIGFFEGAIGRQKMSVMGGNILKRFNWILDTENRAIYLEVNDLAEASFF